MRQRGEVSKKWKNGKQKKKQTLVIYVYFKCLLN